MQARRRSARTFPIVIFEPSLLQSAVEKLPRASRVSAFGRDVPRALAYN